MRSDANCKMICGCSIEICLDSPFSRLKVEEKTQIIKNGRPTPELPNLTTKNKTFIRHFKTSNYKEKAWLCGCPLINKLFCWPCLLFASKNEKSVWTTGYNDLNHFTASMIKHQTSQVHISNTLTLKTFGKVRIDVLLDEQKRISLSRHNEQVSENRNVFERLVDSVCFLGAQELAFRGNDEKENSDNRGNYVEILHLIAKYDSKLDRHLSTSTIFKGTSNRIQNDIINSISTVILNNIEKELNETLFIAVMLDETTDIKKVSIINNFSVC